MLPVPVAYIECDPLLTKVFSIYPGSICSILTPFFTTSFSQRLFTTRAIASYPLLESARYCILFTGAPMVSLFFMMTYPDAVLSVQAIVFVSSALTIFSG